MYHADRSVNAGFTYRATTLLDDIRVIDMYNDSILETIAPEERVGHWTEEYFELGDILKVIETQFRDIDRIKAIITNMQALI